MVQSPAPAQNSEKADFRQAIFFDNPHLKPKLGRNMMSDLRLLSAGQPAPSFSYTEGDGSIHNTRDLAKKPYVVYFYPKDDTPGCTKEACAFRDTQPEFLRRGLTVIGVSPDDDASHQKFRAKFNLPFALASDPDHTICKAFGAWGPKSFMGRQYEGVHRVTFLINEEGRVARTYPNLKPEEHARRILEDTPESP